MGFAPLVKSCERLFVKAPFKQTLPKDFAKTIKSSELKLCPNFLKSDVLEVSKPEILTKIEDLLLRYAPENTQARLIEKYRNYAKDENSITVLESLYEGIQKHTTMGEKDIKKYNRLFNNLKKLQENNPEEFQTMIDGGFFKLLKEGKIHLHNFDTDLSNARISRALLSDLQKVAKGEDFVPDLSHLSMDKIRTLVKSGDTYLKDGKLFVNQHGVINEVLLTKEKYLELFPPVLRNISNQGYLGNCWVVGQLDNMITSESGRAGLLKLFRQEGNDIFIKFPECDKEILFPNGRILTTKNKKQMTTVPGLAMIEQALAVHCGNRYTHGAITNIEQFSKHPDMLMDNLNGINFVNPALFIKDIFKAYKSIFSDIFVHNSKPLQDICNSITGETIDSVTFLGCNAYSKSNLITKLRSIFNFKHNKKIMSEIIDNQANEQDLHIGISCKLLTPKKYHELCNMVPQHQLTLKGCEGNNAYISNPWFNWIEKGVDKETLLKYIRDMQVPFVWG